MEPNGYMNISIFGDSTCLKRMYKSVIFLVILLLSIVAMQNPIEK